MQKLKQSLLDGAFLLDLNETDMRAVLARGLDYVVAKRLLPDDRRGEVEAKLREQDRLAHTTIGHAVAIPHAYSDGFTAPIVLFIRLRHALNLGAPDGIPIRFVFLLLGPPGAPEAHLDTLAAIARLTSDEEFRFEAGGAETQLDLVAALDAFQQRQQDVAPLPTMDPGLVYSGRWGAGLWADIKRRGACYASDFSDGVHPKVLASVLFLFFACLAPAVTFGGVLAELTDNQIGVVEMLVATAIGGVLYALTAGQPMILLGGTGPLLVFTWVLYMLCQRLQLSEYFLECYAWVGLWTALFLGLLALLEASCLMRYVTRFTDETFAALMSVIFIYTALHALLVIVSQVYQTQQVRHDEALVPMILTGGTFFLGFSLSRFRRSRYLWPALREFLADFGPAIAMGGMTLLAITWFSDVETKSLNVRDSLSPSQDRSWLINPFLAPQWVWAAAAIPAVLAALLIFIVHNITARLVNSQENQLRKGAAYHLDLAVLGGLVALCSLFGLPWLVAATVRSLNQLRSLADIEEYVTRDGQQHERVLRVRENRVTALAIHVLIGASLLVLPLLKAVPLTVLYGLFLYMGIVSMAGNQLFERMGLLATDPALYPSTHYVRRVPFWTIHAFTMIQVCCVAVLTVVSFTSFAIVLPLLLVLLAPIRLALDRVFEPEHLAALDAEEARFEEEDSWL